MSERAGVWWSIGGRCRPRTEGGHLSRIKVNCSRRPEMDPGMAHAHSSISRSLLQDCFDEVTARITDIAGRSTPFRVDESGLGRLRTISAPQQRRAAKAGYSFSGSRPGTLIRIWDHIWRSSDLMEVMHQALYTYQHKPLQKQEFTKIRSWIDCCTCWEHSDDLSKIYADVTERNPEWILPTLQRWNNSRNPWKRRQSVVALIEYASKRTRFLPDDDRAPENRHKPRAPRPKEFCRAPGGH